MFDSGPESLKVAGREPGAIMPQTVAPGRDVHDN